MINDGIRSGGAFAATIDGSERGLTERYAKRTTVFYGSKYTIRVRKQV